MPLYILIHTLFSFEAAKEQLFFETKKSFLFLYTCSLLEVYIGRVASIYRTCCIYMSDVSHLYIQRHRYIDAKGTG